MSFGEALVHGLLKGTSVASEVHVENWRDKVAAKRQLAAQKEAWKHGTEERKQTQLFTEGMANKQRNYDTKKSKAEMAHQLTLKKLELDKKYNNDLSLLNGKYANELKLYQGQKEADTETLKAERAHELKLKKFELGKKYNNDLSLLNTKYENELKLYKGQKEVDSEYGNGVNDLSDLYQTIKTPDSRLGDTVERTQYTDPETGQKFFYKVNLDTGLLETVPVGHNSSGRPVSENKRIEADLFADRIVDDLASFIRSDKKDFAAWGGSREAARLYFRENFLNGTVLDDQGKLRLPGGYNSRSTNDKPKAENSRDYSIKSKQVKSMYESLSPDKKEILLSALRAVRDEGRNAKAVRNRLLEVGFTEDQIGLLFD